MTQSCYIPSIAVQSAGIKAWSIHLLEFSTEDSTVPQGPNQGNAPILFNPDEQQARLMLPAAMQVNATVKLRQATLKATLSRVQHGLFLCYFLNHRYPKNRRNAAHAAALQSCRVTNSRNHVQMTQSGSIRPGQEGLHSVTPGDSQV